MKAASLTGSAPALVTSTVFKGPREFAFSQSDFDKVKALVYRHSGIALTDAKQDMVYRRLSKRLRELGKNSFQDYLKTLDNPNDPEWETFTNALTTNLTSFFREDHHFPMLIEHLRANHKAGTTPQLIWCSAASTGEEPWTLAITAAEAFDTLSPPVQILATDIDTHVLKTAETGIYTEERVKELSPQRLSRFFDRLGDGTYRIKEELRRIMTYRQINLIAPNWPIRPPVDAIFCRNVMIYFDKETQAAIIKRMAPLMRANGLLFIGHSENIHHSESYFALRGKTVYELQPGVAQAADR